MEKHRFFLSPFKIEFREVLRNFTRFELDFWYFFEKVLAFFNSLKEQWALFGPPIHATTANLYATLTPAMKTRVLGHLFLFHTVLEGICCCCFKTWFHRLRFLKEHVLSLTFLSQNQIHLRCIQSFCSDQKLFVWIAFGIKGKLRVRWLSWGLLPNSRWFPVVGQRRSFSMGLPKLRKGVRIFRIL